MDCILEIEGCALIKIEKQEIDANEPPVLHWASDVSVHSKSVAYLTCTRVEAVSRNTTAMCLAGTNTLANGTGLLLANKIINPNIKIFVQVFNVMETPINVK